MGEVDHVREPPDLLPFLWSHSHWHPPTAPPVPKDSTTTTTSTTPTKKKQPPTRTDNLKKRYRGDPMDVPPEALAELAKQGITYEAFDEYLENELVVYKVGDVVKGVCIDYMHKSCLVEIGAKGSAILPMEEFAIELPPKPRIFDLIQKGDEVTAEIIDRDPWSGKWIISKRSIELREHWERLEQLVLSKENVEAEVLSFNRGGYLCWCSGSPAFMPRSHMIATEADMGIVGKTMTVQAIGINRERGYLTISRKMAMAEATMAKYKWGDIVDGIVFKSLPYGVLVRFDGAQGLVHKSNLSHEDVPDIEKLFPTGTKIRCMIIRVLPDGQGISLSTKALEAEPGQLLRDPKTVFANAEITVPLYIKRKEEEQKVKSSATESMLEKLKNSLDSMVADNNRAAAAATREGGDGEEETAPGEPSFESASPLRSKLRTTPISMKDLEKRDEHEREEETEDDLDQQAEEYERSILFDGPEDHLESTISTIQPDKDE
eukprot:Nitzschia sp. Nitz4//scaffold34_size148208//88474//90222//NITZ4_002987-RA/size148208-augustus-gene-0.60-mRNA-1//1//CDS//3329548816//8226//frame0